MINATPTLINSALAHAAVGAVVALGEMHDVNTAPSEIDSAQDSTSVEILAEDVNENAATDYSNRIVLNIEDPSGVYGIKDEKRFDELVVLRATGAATEELQNEFRELQAARRAAVQDNSSAAILAEFRRRQVLIDALKFLNRHVRFLQPEDQKKFRTIV